MATNRTPAGYEFDEDGRIYPDPSADLSAPVKVKGYRTGELSRLDREHDFEPVQGDNPIAELRAADAARVADKGAEQTHFGSGV